jgi:hypothetical protein
MPGLLYRRTRFEEGISRKKIEEQNRNSGLGWVLNGNRETDRLRANEAAAASIRQFDSAVRFGTFWTNKA